MERPQRARPGHLRGAVEPGHSGDASPRSASTSCASPPTTGSSRASDDVRVTLLAEPPPTLDAEDAVVTEGNEGLTGASVELRLSKPWPQDVTVDYVTEDRTASRPCDYARRFGTLAFPPGETTRTVLVPVVGDQVAEGEEQLAVLLGNPSGAILARDAATIRIEDDDLTPNEPPSPLAARAPADGAARPRLAPDAVLVGFRPRSRRRASPTTSTSGRPSARPVSSGCPSAPKAPRPARGGARFRATTSFTTG